VRKLRGAEQHVEHGKTAPGEIVARLADATVAIVTIVNKVPMRAASLRELPLLKMIAVAATGM
jgi:glycerate dehydrogenase